jgi:hypothetical protein
MPNDMAAASTNLSRLVYLLKDSTRNPETWVAVIKKSEEIERLHLQ